MKVSELLKQIGSWGMEIANPPEVQKKIMYEQMSREEVSG